MEKLELAGIDVDVLRGLIERELISENLTSREEAILRDIVRRMGEVSARGKTVTVSLSHSVVFEGDVLEEYLEQLDDYEDTPSQREWFVLDQLFDHELAHIKRVANLEVTEE